MVCNKLINHTECCYLHQKSKQTPSLVSRDKMLTNKGLCATIIVILLNMLAVKFSENKKVVNLSFQGKFTTFLFIWETLLFALTEFILLASSSNTSRHTAPFS